MARKPRKSRPKEKGIVLLGRKSHNVLKPNRTKRPTMIVGYARTSTTDQKAGLDAQVRDLTAAGAEKMFSEQCSSKAPRPNLVECLRFLREGDTLMVTKPDRLARSTADLLTIADDLVSRGVGLIIQSMGLDTRNGSNPTAKLMLAVIGAIAQFERELMLERQREGIAKAKAEGRYKGRPPSLDRAAIHRMKADGIGPAVIAEKLGVARSSVYRILEATGR
jgi:DNA invertase Pin-like site-specific DNA recombinase